jgi:hypothetical protein
MTKTSLLLCVMMLACTPGPQGPEGPQGPAGPTGAPGAPGADAVIANGSITREKLARESVLPEHRGRSNSVVSFVVQSPSSPAGVPRVVGPLYTVPADKNLVITDLMLWVTDYNFGGPYPVELRPVGGQPRALWPVFNNQAAGARLNLESGVRFLPGETLELVLHPSAGSPSNPLPPIGGFLSGYEY